MQYESITYQRVIVPKSYESKRLEVTVKLHEGDDPNRVARQLMKQVEDLIQMHYDILDGEYLTATVDKLEEHALLQSSQQEENLDNIRF